MLAAPLLAVLAVAAACSPSPPPLSSNDHTRQVEEWFAGRIERLEAEGGWLSLVGLLPLPEGDSSFGTDQDSRLRFPGRDPGVRLGTFARRGSSIEVRAADEQSLQHDGRPITSIVLHTDQPGPATILTTGDLSFLLIERGDRLLIRIRDRNSQTRADFRGIERWPIDSKWRLRAQFESHPDGTTVAVPNILGDINQEASPGVVRFTIDGRAYSIDALAGASSGTLFLVFGDLTNGKATYAGGRFLYSEVPQDDGSVIIDFNQAYNPPCVFTPFATCPLPPPQNQLALEVTAGELAYTQH